MTAYKAQNDSIKSNDAKYIHDLCRQQIQKATNPEDLLPMIKLLIPMDELKDKLLETVDALHNSAFRPESNANDRGDVHKLKQLYLNSSSILEIFSNSILMNIMRFIPPQQFVDVSRVSSHFRKIMVENLALHNDYEMTMDEALNGISISFKGCSKSLIIPFNVSIDRFYCVLQMQRANKWILCLSIQQMV